MGLDFGRTFDEDFPANWAPDWSGAECGLIVDHGWRISITFMPADINKFIEFERSHDRDLGIVGRDVSGVGDQAVYFQQEKESPKEPVYNRLYVRIGDRGFFVSVDASVTPDPQSVDTRIARIVADPYAR
ncbi:hypothetical protein [Yinghuangia aomiensis]|uniref:hypothetical protein n=1 Tax=Yinghuangia aomiensis TaxID=676205 RepID=UPI0031F11E61